MKNVLDQANYQRRFVGNTVSNRMLATGKRKQKLRNFLLSKKKRKGLITVSRKEIVYGTLAEIDEKLELITSHASTDIMSEVVPVPLRMHWKSFGNWSFRPRGV